MNTKGLKISPRALALAMQNQIDIADITPTGPDGRIIERDVWRHLEKAKDIPKTSIKQEETLAEEITIEEVIEEPIAEEISMEELIEAPMANEMPLEDPDIEIEITVEEPEPVAMIAAPVVVVKNEEKAEEPKAQVKEKSYTYGTDAYRHTDVIIPRTEKAPDGTPFTVTMSFDASAIVRLHRMMKENGESMGFPHITINDMILFAVSKQLKKNKALNAHFLGDKIRYFDGVHLGFVVDTGHGMETPTVFDADRLSLTSLAKITGALVRGARAGNVSPEKNKLCASFMVSNLGTLGVEAFTPVLQEPQTGILGVCALQKRLKEINGQDVSYPAIPLSLTFDPRAIDTTGAVKFLRELCASLENFELLLIK